MALDVEAARAAVGQVAEAMGLRSRPAAEGILAIVNENMAGALRVISVQRGHDPREFALVAFGGAGPLHANAVAELMGSFPVIVPPSPGLLCALGDLVADFRNEFARTLIRLTRDDDRRGRRRTILDELGGRARAWMDAEGIAEPSSSGHLRGRHALPRPGLRDPGADSASATSRGSRSASTRCTSSSTASACPTPPRRSSTCARSATARGRRPSCRRAEPGGADASRRRDRRAASADAIYDRAPLRPGHRFSGPGDRDRVRLHHRRPARLRGRGRPPLQHPDHGRRSSA